eukprot:g6102.t1
MALEVKKPDELVLDAVIGFGGNVRRGLIYHPSGRFVLYPLGTTIVIKNILTGKQEFLQGHTDKISCLCLSNNGKLLASGQKTHMGFLADVILWDLEKRALRYRMTQHKVCVLDVCFNSDDTLLASIGGRDDGRVFVWQTETGDAIRTERTNSAQTVSWYKNDNNMMITGGKGVMFWQVRSSRGGKMTPFECSLGQYSRVVTCLATDDEDNMVYCGTKSGDILVVALATKKFSSRFTSKEFGQRGVTTLVFCNDNGYKYLLCGDGNGTISLIEISDRRLILKRVVDAAGEITSISNGYDFKSGKDTFVGTAKGNMYIMNSRTLQFELRGTAHYTPIHDVSFPAGCSELFVTSATNDIRVWDAHKRQELLRIQVPNLVCNCIKIVPDGSQILSGWDDGKIRSFAPQSGTLRFVITDAHQGAVTSINCTDSQDVNGYYTIVSGGSDGRVRMWSRQRMLASFKEHKASVSSLRLTKDDTELVSASEDGSCIVWNMKKFTRLNAFFANTMFRSVLYHPDESQILTCGSDRKITYWDASDVNAIRVLEGSLEGELNALDIEPDGVLFVAGGNDKLVKVWHYDDGILKAQGVGHSGGISSLKISPNQKQIVSVGKEGAVFVWRMPAEGAVDLKAQGIMPESHVKDEIETVRDDEGNTARTAGGSKKYRSLK